MMGQLKGISRFLFFLLFCSLMADRAVAYTVSFDEYPATDEGTQIGEEYAHLGIHFITNTAGLTEPGISFYLSTILPPGPENEIFWYPPAPPEGCSYDSYPYPTTNYLAMDKPQGVSVTTGVAMRFDAPCTGMSFLLRRPGNNNTTTSITVAFFDTSQSAMPFYTTQLTAYVCTPLDLDPNEDGWQAVDLNGPLAPFDLVLFYADKQFAIDNLVYTVDDCPGDSDTDGDEICNKEDNCPNDSNPEQGDSDGDGIGDACDTNPLDRDKDGVSNTEESSKKTNPNDNDTDNDSLSDGEDVYPLDPDANNDGIIDH